MVLRVTKRGNKCRRGFNITCRIQVLVLCAVLFVKVIFANRPQGERVCNRLIILTDCGIVTTHGVIDFAHYWFRLRLGAWLNKATPWINSLRLRQNWRAQLSTECIYFNKNHENIVIASAWLLLEITALHWPPLNTPWPTFPDAISW